MGLVTSTDLDGLLPDLWQESNPSHRWTIDEIRGKERRQKEAARHHARAKVKKRPNSTT